MAQYTSPRAMGTPKVGSTGGQAGAYTGKLSLKQQGGEGQNSYDAKKTDMKYPQAGGEGGGKEGKVKSESDMGLLDPTTGGYKAGGRDLKCEAGN